MRERLKAIRDAAAPLAQASREAAARPVPGLVASLRAWRGQSEAPTPARRGIAVVAITRHGITLAGRVVAALPGAQLYCPEKFKAEAEAAARGAAHNPLGADRMEPLLAKAISGIDAAVLQAVEANRRALEQMVAQGASLRETQVKKALADIEKMEDLFFDTVRKSLKQAAGPLEGAWGQVLEKMQMKGGGSGAHAAQSLEQLTEQAQAAMRQSRAASVKAMGALLDSYAAVASGVLIGMSQGMQAGVEQTTGSGAKARK